MEVRKIFKQGDSLCITIPKAIVDQLQLKDGDYIIIDSKGGYIEVRKYFE
jgi:AbrB family looped-hinge helix DNA binding protein